MYNNIVKTRRNKGIISERRTIRNRDLKNQITDYHQLFTIDNNNKLRYNENNITIMANRNNPETIFLVAFLKDTNPEIGLKIYNKLSQEQKKMVDNMVSKYHLTINFLDDTNLEYGIVPPRFIKDDLFNTYLQF